MSTSRIAGLSCLLIGVVLSAATVAAQARTDADEALEQLAWAIGGKWIAEIKGPDDKPLTVEATFEWAGHRKAIKYAVAFKSGDKSATNYEGVYYWHPKKKQLAMLQIDRQGNVNESLLTREGDHFKQRNSVTMADGTKREQRAEFIREGDDAFAFKAFVPKGDDWVEAVALKYKRVRDSKKP